MNVAIQLFTLDATRRALHLLHALDLILVDSRKGRAVWVEHDGSRRTATLEKILNDSEGVPKLNEAYIQASARQIVPELIRIGARALTVHLSVSPDCGAWAHSSEPAPSGKPSIRKVLSYVQSVERAAAFRRPQPMPTVLEITVAFDLAKNDVLMNAISDVVKRSWPLMDCVDKFATVDWGGEWLFFPKSGYNPNISNIHAFFSGEACTAWPSWRERHNVSFASKDKDSKIPEMVVHSLNPQQQPV